MNKKICTENAPAAIGPYSQAVQYGGMLYISGMMPIDPKSGELVESDITRQAEQIMVNIDAVLKEAGYTVEDVIKTTCFLSDIANFAAFNAVYGNYFTGKPARSCVAVRDLPKGALAEVEVIAGK
ncbi:MAG: RidA family protein [Erysipelotrichaceae bacterium]|nr:RidA family protein [Erysipelotrichaceae bacterium]